MTAPSQDVRAPSATPIAPLGSRSPCGRSPVPLDRSRGRAPTDDSAAGVAPHDGLITRRSSVQFRAPLPVRPGQDAPGPGCGANASVLRGTASGHASSPSRERLAGSLAGHLYAAPGREPVRTPVAASPGLITRPASSGASTQPRREPGYALALTTVVSPPARRCVGAVFSVVAAVAMASPVGGVIWWWGGRA